MFRKLIILLLVVCMLPVSVLAERSHRPNHNGRPNGNVSSNEVEYLLEIQLRNRSYGLNAQNMVIYWVQTQLKATGCYYQGYQWDVTGNLGDHTMSEIKAFMQDRGYSRHTGRVDQDVIDELTAYLGRDVVPVYVGGFYEGMNSLMTGGSAGSMNTIVCNLRDMVPRVTTGGRWIQVCLKYLGYYNGTVDGKYGEGTDKAVRRFQADHDFQERDYVSLGVARAMLEEYVWAGGSIDRLP